MQWNNKNQLIKRVAAYLKVLPLHESAVTEVNHKICLPD
jgi:hypothetical protein